MTKTISYAGGIITWSGAYSLNNAYSLIKILRPGNYIITINTMIGPPSENRARFYTEQFAILSDVKKSFYEEYTASLDDFNFFRITQNIPYNAFFIKVVNGQLWFCAPGDQQFEVTVNCLSHPSETFVVEREKVEYSQESCKLPQLYPQYRVSPNDTTQYMITLEGSDSIKFNTYNSMKVLPTQGLRLFSNSEMPISYKLQAIKGKYSQAVLNVQRKDNNIIIIQESGPSEFTFNAVLQNKTNGNIILFFPQVTTVQILNTTSGGYCNVINLPENIEEYPTETIFCIGRQSSSELIKNSGYTANTIIRNINGQYGFTTYNGIMGFNGFDTTYSTKGTFANKPTLEESHAGFEYYDTSSGRKILWNGTKWVNMDGTDL